jgi:hypothetical protein
VGAEAATQGEVLNGFLTVRATQGDPPLVATPVGDDSVTPCVPLDSVYNGRTNQVPATWIVGEAGIRRLASHSDGPFWGRRFVFTESGETRLAMTEPHRASP